VSVCVHESMCVWVCVLLARYLTNQWTEFCQILADDVVEGTDELTRFSRSRGHSQGHNKVIYVSYFCCGGIHIDAWVSKYHLLHCLTFVCLKKFLVYFIAFCEILCGLSEPVLVDYCQPCVCFFVCVYVCLSVCLFQLVER